MIAKPCSVCVCGAFGIIRRIDGRKYFEGGRRADGNFTAVIFCGLVLTRWLLQLFPLSWPRRLFSVLNEKRLSWSQWVTFHCLTGFLPPQKKGHCEFWAAQLKAKQPFWITLLSLSFVVLRLSLLLSSWAGANPHPTPIIECGRAASTLISAFVRVVCESLLRSGQWPFAQNAETWFCLSPNLDAAKLSLHEHELAIDFSVSRTASYESVNLWPW